MIFSRLILFSIGHGQRTTKSVQKYQKVHVWIKKLSKPRVSRKIRYFTFYWLEVHILLSAYLVHNNLFSSRILCCLSVCIAWSSCNSDTCDDNLFSYKMKEVKYKTIYRETIDLIDLFLLWIVRGPLHSIVLTGQNNIIIISLLYSYHTYPINSHTCMLSIKYIKDKIWWKMKGKQIGGRMGDSWNCKVKREIQTIWSCFPCFRGLEPRDRM